MSYLELFNTTMGVAGLIAAFFGLAVAFRLSKSTDRNIDRHITDLIGKLDRLDEAEKKIEGKLIEAEKIISEMNVYVKEARSALSTSHIGNFPEYMDEITKALNRATNEVRILIDQPAYGSVSSPNEFSDISNIIEKYRTTRGVKLQLMFSNEQFRKSALERQFAQDDIVDFLNANELSSKAVISDYNAQTGSKLVFENCKKDDFITALMHKNNKLAAEYMKMYEVKELNSFNNYLFMWIIDKSEAIFCVPSYENDLAELAFSTNDRRLIDALVTIFDTTWKSSSLPPPS